MSADFANFQALDVRVGTVISAVIAQTKKPTYRMSIDFGPELGTRVSCGAYTNYPAAEIIGKQVVAVVNLGARKMGPETSEVLVLGVSDPNGTGTIFLAPDRPAPNGSRIF